MLCGSRRALSSIARYPVTALQARGDPCPGPVRAGPVREGHVAVAREDDVVAARHVEEPSRIHELSGRGPVVDRRRGVAARVAIWHPVGRVACFFFAFIAICAS